MADLFDELIKSVDDLTEDQVTELMSRLALKRKHIELQEKIKDIEIHDIACVHCGSVDIRKHGKKNNRQRYYCKDCGKTFVNSTGSVMLTFSSDSLDECKSYVSFMESKFVKFLMLSSRIGTMVGVEAKRFVPAPEAFDHIFTDAELYEKYNLTAEEIKIIEAVIKERK